MSNVRLRGGGVRTCLMFVLGGGPNMSNVRLRGGVRTCLMFVLCLLFVLCSSCSSYGGGGGPNCHYNLLTVHVHHWVCYLSTGNWYWC